MKPMRAVAVALLCLLLNPHEAGSQSARRQISVDEYRDKVLGSWLGQCIGNVYGLPHENDYIDEPGPETFPYGYDSNSQRLKETNGVFSDDDTDIEYMYLLAMEKHGAEPTLSDLASMWKHHVRDRVWLANRAGLAAMHHGYTPPMTGKRANNPHWFQIDPQLINEVWAVTAPGMVRYAAAKSDWAARVMDDEWGVEPTIWYGAMYAAAFFESNVNKLIDIGVAALPKGSRFAKTVADMRALHRKHPDDWKAARQAMAKQYYHDEPAESKTIWNANLNAAAGVLAMLYGEGDFQKTLDLSCAMGFDADNQAATVAGLLGIVLGAKGLPRDLLFPFPELGWTEPFNDFYRNVTRYDMPDAGLKDMADRMAAQGEKIILAKGGRKTTVNGRDAYEINTQAEFVAPLELPSGPGPFIEVGESIEFEFPVFGGKPPYRWRIESGSVPAGLRFADGKLSGTAKSAGVYPVVAELTDSSGKSLSRPIKLVVRTRNLAPAAAKVLSNVETTDTAVRDAMWLSVPSSLYAPQIQDVIRDGKRLGNGSTFYSITASGERKEDYYGFEWNQTQTIGLLGYHGGSVEENGGWFTSLRVEYRDAQGEWRPVQGLLISPPLAPGNEPYNKPHFVEYLLAFPAVETKAIRMIGQAGGARHWHSKLTYFTSISELSVHGALPRHEHLNR
jgi:hypothetical protein